MPEPVVRLDAVSRRFGEITAVDNLSFEVHQGEIYGLVGPDGAGKTTTLRILCGLIEPTTGEAWVAGHNVHTDVEAVKDCIGYMAQRFGLYTDLTVAENMEFYADLFGVPVAERAELGRRLLHMTRMEPFQNRQAGRLSGGMKQKLALMCTLLHKPAVLFLDEPTNGVDPVSRRDFWTILYQLAQDGVTIVLTTAYLDEAERCGRLALIDRGRLVREDTPLGLRTKLGDRCYVLDCADRRRARALLEQQPGVASAEPFGASLHVFIDPSESVESLSERLAEAGIGHCQWSEVVPSLEDVFIALVKRSQEAA
ncbi:MAG: ABC transporter ATP-binding protein [Bryobacterales bacterium]|nr:ABC transporter ATP-binding protein [Bryobacterales bacterium]